LIERRLRRRLARNVLARRQDLGLSHEAAAHAASMDPRHWRKVETGAHAVTLRTLAKLALALHVEPGALLL
jgi:transcriptional regulator with XRE-family HTH domain